MGLFVAGFVVVVDEPAFESLLAVVILSVVPLIVVDVAVVCMAFPNFPVVAKIFVVVIMFCVEVAGNGLTLVGFGRKVVVGLGFCFSFSFSGHGAAAQL